MTLPRHTLRSTVYDLADALDENELSQQKGWTDGLPIVPPTVVRSRILARSYSPIGVTSWNA
jgi:hypothetical protein